MQRITLIDSQTAGISGDMLLAALIDAGASLASVEEAISIIPQYFPKCRSIRLETREVRKHGFKSRSVTFALAEKNEETTAQELIDVAQRIADASKLSGKAKSFATGSVRSLADVEGRLHGLDPSKTHLHEAGSTDTLADVFGVAASCDSLGVFDGEVYATPVAIGGGSVSFSHGTIATPAPAVLELTRQNGVPIVGGPEAEELATPTGLSMLVNLTKKFLANYPSMVPERVGYGAGRKELTDTPNLLRVVLGHSIDTDLGSETIQVLETNLDDVPGEILGHALHRILDAGAKDAWITPALFKKSRPGHVLHAICELNDIQKIAGVMMRETGTLGVRFEQWSRLILQRAIEHIKVEIASRTFEVSVKLARDGDGKLVRAKPEFDDIRSISEQLSMPARDVSAIVVREIMKTEAARKSGA